MAIALFFLSILITILIISLIILLSTVKITVDKLKISNDKEGCPARAPLQETEIRNKIDIILNSIDVDAKLNIKLMFLNKIPILKINLGNSKILEVVKYKKIKEAMAKIELDDIKDKENLEYFKYLKYLNIKTKKFKLDFKIGTENAIITSFLVTAIASGIGILLSKTIKKYNNKDYKYVITPMYLNKNIIEIGLFCIIQIKMVHIIHIIYLLLKRRRVDKYERTSNRRPYDYSYE